METISHLVSAFRATWPRVGVEHGACALIPLTLAFGEQKKPSETHWLLSVLISGLAHPLYLLALPGSQQYVGLGVPVVIRLFQKSKLPCSTLLATLLLYGTLLARPSL